MILILLWAAVLHLMWTAVLAQRTEQSTDWGARVETRSFVATLGLSSWMTYTRVEEYPLAQSAAPTDESRHLSVSPRGLMVSLIISAIAGLTFLFLWHWLVMTPQLRGRCDECGYDLRGLRDEGRCPECGTGIAQRL